MEQISNKLNRIKTAKEDIKTSLENKGLEVDDNIETYASKIDEMQTIDFEINDWAYMFYNGYRKTNIKDFVKITKNVQNMLSAFESIDNNGGVNTTEIDLRGLDTSRCMNFNSTWRNCSILKEIITDDGLDCSYGTQFYRMCASSKKLEKFKIKNYTSSIISDTRNMFYDCTNLNTLIIDGNDVFPMTNTNMLQNSLIANGGGYVYVPDNLVDSYKSATNWSTYASQIKGMSELV